VCVYKAPSGKYKVLKLFDIALQSPNTPTTELLTCGDINVDYLTSSCQKQQLSLLLDTYSMFHMVNFPTRFLNNHASAIDNKYLDLSRLHVYMILPLSCGLSDHDAQCVISKSL